MFVRVWTRDCEIAFVFVFVCASMAPEPGRQLVCSDQERDNIKVKPGSQRGSV